MKRYHIVFKGKVQGVGFRYTSKMIADKLNITGSVKNLNNGDAEAYVQGNEDDINKFIEELKNQRFIKIEDFYKKEVELKEENDYKIIG